MSFEKVFTQGTLVDINIRVWRAQISLKAEEIGLRNEDIPTYYELGKKRLIPKNLLMKFFSLENTARSLLIKYSYSFAFGEARFVPKKCLLEFTNKFQLLQEQFEELKKEFLSKYDTYRLQMRPHFTEAAEISYKNAVAMSEHDHKELGITEDEYKNNYLEKIEMNYPAVEELEKKFKMEYNVFQVALPDLTSITYADITEQDSKISLLENTQRKQLLRKVDQFFGESIRDIRSRVTDALDRFEQAINGQHNKVSFSRIKEVLNTYEKMCFFDDKNFLVHVNIFREKCLDGFDSRMVRRDKTAKNIILEQIAKLKSIAQDQNSINEIIQQFRQKMNL